MRSKLPFILAAATLGIAMAGTPAIAQSEGLPAEALAYRALVTGEPAGRGLRLEARLWLDEAARASAGSATAVLEVLVEPSTGTFGGPARFEVTLLLALIEGEPVVRTSSHEAATVAGAGGWLLRARVEIPEDTDLAAVVVEETSSGRWAAAPAELADRPLAADRPGLVVETADLRPAAAGAAETSKSQAIRLLAPTGGPLTGKVRLRTLAAAPEIGRAVFFLDGEQVAEDDSRPFGATVDLGPEVAVHTVRVEAFSAGGRPLGEDSLVLNSREGAPSVAIVRARYDPAAGTLVVEAEVTPADPARLERLEVYRGETLEATLRTPPLVAELPAPAPPGPSDFVRVVAHFRDGSSVEDARLLAAAAERVEVNLVEFYCVVTNRSGAPVTGLERGDFELLRKGRPQTIESFGPAEAVPLALGLVIDTSESMWTLMPDTKKAGATFLAETVEPGDTAFLVDFDTQPRLAHAATGDVIALLRSFGALRADGWTALYDAVIFSLLQFEEGRGRRALVVLTDGDDYRSRYGLRGAVEQARAAGVPVYVIGLGGLHDQRAGMRKIEMESLAESTGGRVFYIDRLEALAGAYSTIRQELRSQYLLTHSTPRRLTDDEVEEFRVKMRDGALEVRAAVGRPE